MSTTTDYLSEIDAWMPNTKVLEDIRRVVETDARGLLELDSGNIAVPPNTDYEVISKALISQPRDIGLGPCFRVVVAIGGLESTASGIQRSRFAFSTVWYTLTGEIITTDFGLNCPI